MQVKSVFSILIALALASYLQAQTFTVLHKFNLKDGQVPQGTLIRDANGNLYGTTVFGGKFAGGGQYVGKGTVFRIAPNGQHSVLYNFSGQPDGRNPYAGLTIDGDSLFRTTEAGGDRVCDCGTIFQIDSSGTFSVVHAFTGAFRNPIDGAYPLSGLLKDSAGNLYGDTELGGISCFDTPGCGVVFKVSTSGVESVLYSFLAFNDSGQDGGVPWGNLVADAAGNLYGTTSFGGLLDCNSQSPNTGCGTVFELSPGPSGWTESVIYRFNGETDGAYPTTGLLVDPRGDLYGTTIGGGDLTCSPMGQAGCGTVFKLSNSGGKWTESVIYAFPGETGGFSKNPNW